MKYLLLLTLGCAPLSTIGTYNRLPSICSRTNVRAVRVQILLADNEHHIRWVGVADPNGHICTEWDLSGDRGRWGYVVMDRDTTWEPWFQAWALR